MDWNARLEHARAEYQQVDYNLDALEGKRERELAEYEQNRSILTTRKHQLEGQLSTLVDLQQEESESLLAEDAKIAQDIAAFRQRDADITQDQIDLLQDMASQYPPSLATLNGIERKLQEQDA